MCNVVTSLTTISLTTADASLLHTTTTSASCSQCVRPPIFSDERIHAHLKLHMALLKKKFAIGCRKRST